MTGRLRVVRSNDVSPESRARLAAWAPPLVVDVWREHAIRARDAERAIDTRIAAMPGPVDRARALRQSVAERAACRRTPELLERLLRDERMRPVWERIATAGAYGAGAGVPQSTIFAAMVIRAHMGPVGEENWTKTQRARVLDEIKRAALRLGKLVAGTGVDEVLVRQHLSARLTRLVSDAAAGQERASDAVWQPPLLSELLFRLAATSDEGEKPCGAALYLHGRRIGLGKGRAYFVRYMAGYLREVFGAVPVSLLVATAAVALDDEKINERQVYRLLEKSD